MAKRLVGLAKDMVAFYAQFARLGHLDDIDEYAYAVGEFNGEVIITVLKQETLGTETLPDDAVFFPQRFLMSRGKTVEGFFWQRVRQVR